MANVTAVNPWTWQDAFGFSQAVDVTEGKRVLFCAGQTSVDAEGNPMHVGDMANQVAQALDNVEAVLAQAGLGLANVVRLNYYTTDVDAFMGAIVGLGERLAKAGCVPSATLLGVQRLFHPDIMVELEATAVV
ncbi:MAG: RidA family protein [Pseudonocardiaceae bacterium]